MSSILFNIFIFLLDHLMRPPGHDNILKSKEDIIIANGLEEVTFEKRWSIILIYFLFLYLTIIHFKIPTKPEFTVLS